MQFLENTVRSTREFADEHSANSREFYANESRSFRGITRKRGKRDRGYDHGVSLARSLEQVNRVIARETRHRRRHYENSWSVSHRNDLVKSTYSSRKRAIVAPESSLKTSRHPESALRIERDNFDDDPRRARACTRSRRDRTAERTAATSRKR